jgi:hypothetical protein
MNLRNPHYLEPVESKADEIAPKIATLMAANASKREFTLDELKAALPAHAADLTQGMLAHIAKKNGWKSDR